MEKKVSPQYALKLNKRDSPTPEDAIARLVLTYAKNVRSDARWSRATLPEFSSRNSTHFRSVTLQKGSDFDKRGWFCCVCVYMHCEFGDSEFVLSLDSLSADDGNSASAEIHRLTLKIGDREHDLDGPLSS
jgi:hypothetical protein